MSSKKGARNKVINLELLVVDGLLANSSSSSSGSGGRRNRHHDKDVLLDLKIPRDYTLRRLHETVASILLENHSSNSNTNTNNANNDERERGETEQLEERDRERDEGGGEGEGDEDNYEDPTYSSSSLLSSSSLKYFMYDEYYGGTVGERKEPLDLDKTLIQMNIQHGDRLVAESLKRRGRKRSKRTGIEFEEDEEHEDTLCLVCTTRIFEGDGMPSRRVRVLVKKYHTCNFLMDDVTSLWNRTGLKFRYGRTVLVAGKTFEELGINENGEVVVTGGRAM